MTPEKLRRVLTKLGANHLVTITPELVEHWAEEMRSVSDDRAEAALQSHLSDRSVKRGRDGFPTPFEFRQRAPYAPPASATAPDEQPGPPPPGTLDRLQAIANRGRESVAATQYSQARLRLLVAIRYAADNGGEWNGAATAAWQENKNREGTT